MANRAPVAAQSAFARLRETLAGIEPGMAPISMLVGEPRHPMPDFVGPVIAEHLAGFGRYPTIRGTDDFREAVADWLDRRFDLAGAIDAETMVLPLNGSREGLFLAAIEAARRPPGKPDPVVLMPNPFYAAYAAGAEAAGAEIVFLDAGPATGHLPDLSSPSNDQLDRTVACYYASPSNPQGAVAPLAEFARLIDLARRHDFMIFSDECYSEIYRSEPPPSVLQAAAATGSFDRVVAFNSLSKRSCLPGLRCGFAAGEPDFLDRWARLRNICAPQVPTPVQAVASAAYRDEGHVTANRNLYNAKYRAAESILAERFGYRTPAGGFFLWLDMAGQGGGEAAAIRLWREFGVRTLPGGYLALPDANGTNPADNYIRVAMVDDLATTEEALGRIARFAD